jgi:hypothetical protein
MAGPRREKSLRFAAAEPWEPGAESSFTVFIFEVDAPIAAVSQRYGEMGKNNAVLSCVGLERGRKRTRANNNGVWGPKVFLRSGRPGGINFRTEAKGFAHKAYQYEYLY